MKKVNLLILLLFLTIHSFSQLEKQADKFKVGVNFGINYSNILYDADLPEFASINNGTGFQLGIIGEKQFLKRVSFSPKIELVFNEGQVEFESQEISHRTYPVEKITVNFISHFTFKKEEGDARAYFYLGPNLKLPIWKTQYSNEFNSSVDLAIDFGIGLDKSFSKFHFSPELRYSFGLLNVNKNPLLKDISYHCVALVFNFLN